VKPLIADLLDALIDKTRKAVSYHDSGYLSRAELDFDANKMISMMEELREALSAYDEALVEQNQRHDSDC
jgi:hypothetical protein